MMNIEKLFQAEKQFFAQYPKGFYDPEMQKIGKKHNIEKQHKFSKEHISQKHFEHVPEVMGNIVKLINRSSMVSLFEKPKFRDYLLNLSPEQLFELAHNFCEMLYGNKSKGFDDAIAILHKGRIAKWPIITAIMYYQNPTVNIFIKPTTTKSVIQYFEIPNLLYNPYPTYKFYTDYRNVIEEMKKNVNPSLYPDNGHFTGFLMMSLPDK